MSKVCLIGNLGGDIIGGQVIKTRELKKVMEEHLGTVSLVDVYQIKKNIFKNIFMLIKLLVVALKESEKVVIVLSSPGYFKVLPLIMFFNAFFRKEIYEVVIGGVRYEYLQHSKLRMKLERKMKKIYVESEYMVKQYRKLGLLNVEYMPNFKSFNSITEDRLTQEFNYKSGLRLCTFSRIDMLKGVDIAIETVQRLCKELGFKDISLDIYGPIDEKYKEKFQEIIQGAENENIRYMGSVKSELAIDILKQYDILLFPTKWHTEGFPGTFIDAMASGLPILANDWGNFHGLIMEDYNGYLIKDNEVSEYIEKILSLYRDKSKLITMKKNALKESSKYQTEVVLSSFLAEIKEKHS